MKKWKSIFVAIAAASAASFAIAQDQAPAAAPATDAPAPDTSVAESNTFEVQTKFGVVKAEKIIENGVTKINVGVSGINSQADIFDIMAEVKKAGDALAGTHPIPASAPTPEGQTPLGGVQGKHSTVLASKEEANGKITIQAVVHSIPADVTAADIAEDFLNALAAMVIENQIQITGKALSVSATFAPGQDPAVVFTVNTITERRDLIGLPRQPDNTINIGDQSPTAL